MTTTAIQPTNVYALVVGIEKYQAGSDYDLNGPANDALQFANWLLDRGVEPGHIHLFLSPLEKNKAVLSAAKARGLTPESAAHDPIARTIRSQLTREGSRGDLLYVFWGGHGIVTKTDVTTRRLFFADTDDNTKWNLNVNSLVESLSTSAFGSGFPQQIFLIDACANAFYQGLAQTIQGEASEVRFGASGEVARSEQFILFASPEYEVATNESDLGTGRFSQAMLDELRRQPLLPDMKTIAEQIQADFLVNQKIPPAYWSKVGNNQVEGVAGRAARFSQFSRSQQLELNRLRSELQDQDRDYKTVQKDLRVELDGTTKNRLKERLNMIAEEINGLEKQIQAIEKGHEG